MPGYSHRQGTVSLKPWFIQPLLFIFGVWFLQQNVLVVKEKTPDVFFGLWQHTNWTAAPYIHSLPTNQTQVLRLGELVG